MDSFALYGPWHTRHDCVVLLRLSEKCGMYSVYTLITILLEVARNSLRHSIYTNQNGDITPSHHLAVHELRGIDRVSSVGEPLSVASAHFGGLAPRRRRHSRPRGLDKARIRENSPYLASRGRRVKLLGLGGFVRRMLRRR